MSEFNGADYNSEEDYNRLTGQMQRVFAVMIDRQWRDLQTIAEKCGDPETSVSAQMRNLRKDRFGGHTVLKKRVGKPGSGHYEYQLHRNGCKCIGCLPRVAANGNCNLAFI